MVCAADQAKGLNWDCLPTWTSEGWLYWDDVGVDDTRLTMTTRGDDCTALLTRRWHVRDDCTDEVPKHVVDDCTAEVPKHVVDDCTALLTRRWHVRDDCTDEVDDDTWSMTVPRWSPKTRGQKRHVVDDDDNTWATVLARMSAEARGQEWHVLTVMLTRTTRRRELWDDENDEMMRITRCNLLYLTWG